MIRTVLGLGNPGKQYQNNRHNYGHMFIDRAIERLNLSLKTAQGAYSYTEARLSDQTVRLCKNATFMNNSGVAARQILARFGYQPHEMLVVYDDIDLPLGKIRLREKGSAGGHRGLRSIIETLATNEIPRLRLGIGPQDEGMPAEDFVLDNFRSVEKDLVAAVLAQSFECLLFILQHDIKPAMERFNHSDLRIPAGETENRPDPLPKSIILT
jgi:PTH1 family peptidyl-tRNA hydrolase